jgi:predicted nuclease with TOPRIM domain
MKDKSMARTSKSTELKETLKLRKLKLEAKRNHLKNLVSKKTRLEIEIKGTLRSLKKDLRRNSKELREATNLSEDEDPNVLTKRVLEEAQKDPELELTLHEIDHLQAEISFLCQTDEIITKEDRLLLERTLS